MYSFKKLIKANEGFSVIELITVIGVFSILGIIALPRFLEVIQRAEKVIAANSISSIKIECESNNSLGRNLIFTPSNLIGYEFDNEGSNKCTGNENFSLVSIIPEDLKTQPSFFYNFINGEISCNYEGSEATQFPECKKIPLSDRKKQRCGDIGDWSKAQKFLQAGHSYLDRDNDGEACEALGRKSNKPEIGEITIKDCYDGDTCTSSEGEKIRLACIDTPELKGKRAILEYRLLKKLDKFYHLEIKPKTGRHHQIRVQLSNIGCIIKGDLKRNVDFNQKLENANEK